MGKIRRAVREDVSEIVRLLADDPLGAKRERFETPLPQRYYDAFEAIDRDDNQELVVMEDNGELIGTLQLTILPYLTYEGGTRGLIEAVRIAAGRRGGGLGVVLTKNIALRANFTWAQSNFDGPSTMSLSGSDINRFYYGGDIQLRVPIGRFSPYVFGGAGGVTLDESGAGTLDSFTKVAGRFGLGVSYKIPGTRFGVFSEGTGWVYDFDRAGFNDTQFDIGWTGGLSYRLF